jgi:hypothetical protein
MAARTSAAIEATANWEKRKKNGSDTTGGGAVAEAGRGEDGCG